MTPNCFHINKERAAAIFHEYTAIVNTTANSVLDMAHSYILDTIELLKRQGLYRMDVKRYCRQTITEIERINSVVKVNVTKEHEQLYLDMLDTLADDAKPDLFKLQMSLKQVYDKHRTPNTDLLIPIEMAWYMLCLATVIHSDICKAVKIKCGVDPSGFYQPVNPQAAFKHWDKVALRLCHYNAELHHDLQNDSNIRLALDIVQRKITDFNRLDDNCAEALRLNPDVVEQYKKEHPDVILNV